MNSFQVQLAALAASAAAALSPMCIGASSKPSKPEELFRLTNVVTVHLSFTAEQWEAIQPKQNESAGFGAMQRMMGPGTVLAPSLFKAGDTDQDKKLSEPEFNALAGKLYDKWIQPGAKGLGAEQLRDGINGLLAENSPGINLAAGGRSMLQGAEGKRNGIASAMGFEFPESKADVEIDGLLLRNASVRYKGNGTFLGARQTDKKSFKLDLNDHVKGQEYAGVSKLNLHNNITDASWMNESLSYRLFRDAKVPAPRTAYAKLYVTVPGTHEKKYFGLYSLVENVDDDFAKHQLGARKGALFKPVTTRPFEYMGENWAAYNQPYDPKADVSDDQQKRLIEFCKFVSAAPEAEFAARIGDFVDIENFSRYMAALVWLSELDGILGSGQNYYVYLHPTTQKFMFFPWDMDHSFGQFPLRGTQEERNELSIQKPWGGETLFLKRMFGAPAFKQAYLAKLSEFSGSLFTPECLAQQVDELGRALRPAVAEESAEKLARFDKLVAGETLRQEGGMGRGFGGFGMTQPIKPFAKVRSGSVKAQLAGKSTGKEVGAFGFGGPGRRPGPRGPGGPGRMPSPGEFLGGGLLNALDQNNDQSLSSEELSGGFKSWAQKWIKDAGSLSEDELIAGLNEELNPFRNGPPEGMFPGGPGAAPAIRPFPRE